MDLLMPIHGAMTEGFDTPDVKEVTALIGELQACDESPLPRPPVATDQWPQWVGAIAPSLEPERRRTSAGRASSRRFAGGAVV